MIENFAGEEIRATLEKAEQSISAAPLRHAPYSSADFAAFLTAPPAGKYNMSILKRGGSKNKTVNKV